MINESNVCLNKCFERVYLQKEKRKKPIVKFKIVDMKHKLFLSLFVLLLGCALQAFAQQTITGTVTDNTGETIIGASVMVKGTSIGSMTDVNGRFSLKSVKKGSTIVVSYIGYKTFTIVYNGSGSVLKIVLQEDNRTLDEVVVVGFGTQKKVNLTGAVATVDTKTLDSRPVTSVAEILIVEVPS